MSLPQRLAASCTCVLFCSCMPAGAQTVLPTVTVAAPDHAAPRKPKRKPVTTAANVGATPRPARSAARGVRRPPIPVAAGVGVGEANGIASGDVAAQRTAATLDRARENLSPRAGANVAEIGADGIDKLPQGANQPLDKVLLQLPGVTQDSAASGTFHIRNEHANVQYRINGIMLPEGITGFGQFLETSFIGNLALLNGALPAQYGLRTAGIVDITSRSGVFDGGGAVSLYGGSRGTVSPSFEYGGHADGWNWFVTGRFVTNRQGLENPAPTFNPIHDRTDQGRYFAYLAKDIDATSRLSFISGAYSGKFQIPNNPGQLPSFTAFGLTDFNSSALNENQYEKNIFNVVSYQKSAGPLDFQISGWQRYSTVNFVPDTVGDVMFNGNATNVFRSSLAHGLQADAAYTHNPAHITRFGMMTMTDHTRVVNGSVVLPLDENGDPVDAPFGIVDRSAKTGYTLSAYVQHEWKLTDRLALNGGLRFDQIWSYQRDNQVSPRASVVWTPVDGTTFHAGYARYFTPQSQVLAAPTNVAAFMNTTLQPEILLNSPVRSERSHYFDIGVDHKFTPNFSVGVDVYYKRARNLLDDGQFGPAVVLTGFNYDRAYNTGVELKALYTDEYLRAYVNFAWARQRATTVTSNQFLFEQDEYNYIANHYIYTDHAQVITASAGANLRIFDKTRVGFDMIYGSGLRAGFANTAHLSPYTQVNLGATQEFTLPGFAKPTTLRFDVVNLFDHSYLIRDGSGIGVFAPQYGQRRGFYAGISQRF